VKVWLGYVRLKWSTMAAVGSEGKFVSGCEGGDSNEWMKKPETVIIMMRMAITTAEPMRSSLFFSSRTLCFVPAGFLVAFILSNSERF